MEKSFSQFAAFVQEELGHELVLHNRLEAMTILIELFLAFHHSAYTRSRSEKAEDLTEVKITWPQGDFTARLLSLGKHLIIHVGPDRRLQLK